MVLILIFSWLVMAPSMYLCYLERNELQKQVDNCLVCNQPDNLKPLIQCQTCIVKPGQVLSKDHRRYEWYEDCRGTGVYREGTIGAIRYGKKDDYPHKEIIIEMGKLIWEDSI